jgi:hypothetical protein
MGRDPLYIDDFLRFWYVVLQSYAALFLQGQLQERPNGESEIDTEAPSRVASM